MKLNIKKKTLGRIKKGLLRITPFNEVFNNAEKMKFPLSIFSINVTKFAGKCGLVTFTEEFFN